LIMSHVSNPGTAADSNYSAEAKGFDSAAARFNR
jgi:hypothetical protein